MERANLFDILSTTTGRDKKWIKGYTKYLHDMSGWDSQSWQNDVVCWRYYNNQMRINRLDYLTKVGPYSLPVQPRHIPIQRNLINALVSQQIHRPFVFSTYLADNKSVSEKNTQRLKKAINQIRLLSKQQYFTLQGKITEIDSAFEEMKAFLQKQPETEEEQQKQMEVRKVIPQVERQLMFLKGSLEEESLLLKKDIEKMEWFFRYEHKDIKEELAQKTLLSLRTYRHVKSESKRAFINKCVTGKNMFFVEKTEHDNYPVFLAVDSMKVEFPKISGISRINKGPWVKVKDYISFQQMMTMYGSEIRNDPDYGESTLKTLYGATGVGSATSMEMVSTPDGGMWTDGLYSGTFEDGNGIKRVRLYFRVPRPVYIKMSPNPHQEGKKFTHFVKQGKKVINEEEFTYSKAGNCYINKFNEAILYNRDEIETYNPSKGQELLTMYTSDIYEGTVLNDNILIRLRKKPFIYRNPDQHSDVNLPVFGPTFSSISEQPYSLIMTTKDLQDLFDVVHTMRELLIALAGVRTILFDRSQKPTDLTDDEWEYHLKMGRAFIQTADKNGRQRAQNFNQWAALDLSMSSGVTQLGNVLQELNQTMGSIIGVTPPTLGQVVDTDQVGTFMESIKRAQLITEILYNEHDEIEAEALTELTNLTLAFTYRDGGEFQLSDKDFGTDIINIPKGLFNDVKVNVLITNNADQARKMEELRGIAKAGFERGNLQFQQLVSVFDTDTIPSLMNKVNYFTERAQEIAEKGRAQNLQDAIAIEKEKIGFAKQFENEWKQKELQIKEFMAQYTKEKDTLDRQLTERDLALQETLGVSNAQLKLLELMNEKESEDNVVETNDKHATINEQINVMKMKLDALMNAVQIGLDDKNVGMKNQTDLKKIGVEEIKAKKMVKEHVSDR